MGSLEVRSGYDLKLKGRTSRYRVIRFGPFPEQDVREDELIVQRHDRRTMRPLGKQKRVRITEVEALCTGLAWDRSGPLWQRITGWYELPKMPGSRFAILAQPTPEQDAMRVHANVAHDAET